MSAKVFGWSGDEELPDLRRPRGIKARIEREFIQQQLEADRQLEAIVHIERKNSTMSYTKKGRSGNYFLFCSLCQSSQLKEGKPMKLELTGLHKRTFSCSVCGSQYAGFDIRNLELVKDPSIKAIYEEYIPE